MKTIYYKSSVAQLCGKKKIIKAVLLNYIFNFHKQNIRKGAGTPAVISLSEFTYQYSTADLRLWSESYIHEALEELAEEKLLNNRRCPDGRLEYSVSDQVALELRESTGIWIGFDLELACISNVYIAVMHRFLHNAVIGSKNKIAYGLNVAKIAEVNCVSEAEAYRIVKGLVSSGVFTKVKSKVKKKSKGLNLTLGPGYRRET